MGRGTYSHTTMPDTKRGRERKGLVKQHQRRRREVERVLERRHADDEIDFDELYEDEELEL